MTWLWVALGGGIGSMLRYGCGRVLASWSDDWPLGTFCVNLLGAFLLGLLFEVGAGRQWGGVDVRVPLGAGLMGGFTTYSSFSLEVAVLLQRGHTVRGLFYLGATVSLGLLASFVGLALGRALAGLGVGGGGG